MANRSYLYSIDFDLTKQLKSKDDRVASLSECNYVIPISFKILLSVNLQKCNSLIWNYEHPIALIGDYEMGKNKLYEFLEQLYDLKLYNNEELLERIKQTKEFLDRGDRKLKYFFLECGEIYDMKDAPLEEQNNALFESILNIEAEIKEYFQKIKDLNNQINAKEKELNEAKNLSWFKKFFSKEVDTLSLERDIKNLKQEKIIGLGIDNWTNVLYYDFEVKQ